MQSNKIPFRNYGKETTWGLAENTRLFNGYREENNVRVTGVSEEEWNNVRVTGVSEEEW